MRPAVKRSLAVLGVLILLAAVANLLLALSFVTPARGRIPGKPLANVIGPGAATHSWPDRTPHAQPWPTITQWQVEGTFGHRRYQVYAANPHPNGTHQMQTDVYGWPLPVLIETNRWWPWEDPAWKITDMPELAMRPVWSGVLLNPLIAVIPLWLACVVPWLAWRWWTRRTRRRSGRCTGCGYDLKGLAPGALCPECGQRTASGGRELQQLVGHLGKG
jgi:hypothetical protein